MADSTKKRDKARAKLEKKQAKAALKAVKGGSAPPAEDAGASPAVRYAELVRGVLSIVLGASLIVALVLGQRGAIISLEDMIDSLFAARAGKIVLAMIAVGLVIYGLKYLRVVR